MEQYITAVDFGTTKMTVAVGEKSSHGIKITAFSEAESKGIHRGDVLNIKSVKNTLCSLVKDVEEQMQDIKDDFKVERLYAGISGANIHCERTTVTRKRKDQDKTIEQHEVEGMLTEAYKSYRNENEVVLHVIPQSYNIDDLHGLTEIEGHQGSEIMGFYILFIGKKNSAEHTKAVINKAGFQVGKLVLEPLASAMGVLTDEEMELGAVMVDIGGGTTDMLIYKDNKIRYSAVIPFGGNAITQDIRQECMVTEKHAEVMKRKLGSCLSSLGAENKFIGITDDHNIITKRIPFRQFFETIEARVEEIIATVKHEIKEAGMEDKINKIVLTGGTANLNQIAVLFRQMTGYSVRQAFPNEKKILSNSCQQIFNYSASTVAGLIIKGFEYESVEEESDKESGIEESGSIGVNETLSINTDSNSDISETSENEKNKKGIFSFFGKSPAKKNDYDNNRNGTITENKTAGTSPKEPKQIKSTLFDDFFNETDDEA